MNLFYGVFLMFAGLAFSMGASAHTGQDVITQLENLNGSSLSEGQQSEVLHLLQVMQEKEELRLSSGLKSEGTAWDYLVCIHASASMLVEGTLLLCHNIQTQGNFAILGNTLAPLNKISGAAGVDGVVVEHASAETAEGGYKCSQIGGAMGWIGARLAWCAGTEAEQSKKLLMVGYQAGSLSEFGGLNIKMIAL